MKEWPTPYSVVYKPYRRSQVWFEGSALMINLNIDFAHQLAGALNGAYNMGRYSKALEKDK